MKRLYPLLCLTLMGCNRPGAYPTNLPAPGLNPQGVPANVQAQTQNTQAVADLYPLAPGHQWRYELRQKQNGEPRPKVKTLQMWTEALPADGPVMQAVLRRGYPDSTVAPNPTLARLYNDRVELSRYQAELLSDFDLPAAVAAEVAAQTQGANEGQNFVTILKAPFEPGQHWEGRLFKGGTETVKVIGWESVTVPAGTFRALKIEHHKQYNNDKSDFLYYWYAPNVGMIKLYEELTVYYGQWLHYESTGELISHTSPAAPIIQP